MDKDLELKKATLYISDDFLLDADKASESEKEQFYKDGFTDDEFGKVHMVRCEAGWIFNPMCANMVFRKKIRETMENEAYKNDVKKVKIGEVHKIDENNYSLAAVALLDNDEEIVREFLIRLN